MVWTKHFGFELHLSIDTEPVESRICRTQQELIHFQEVSRAAFETDGWTRWHWPLVNCEPRSPHLPCILAGEPPRVCRRGR